MLKPNNPELNTELLAERIRQEAQGGRPHTPGPVFSPAPDEPAAPGWRGQIRILRQHPSWKHAVAALPLLGPLARRVHARLGRVRYRMHGLAAAWKPRIAAIPGLGALAYWVHALLRLSALKRHVLDAQAQLFARTDESSAHLQQLQEQQRQLEDRLNVLRHAAEQQVALLEQHVAQDLTWLRHELRLVQQRVPATVPPAAAAPETEVGEQFYAALEDHFRGSRADIKMRLAVYLPYLRKTGAGTPAAPVLDLGCGRGEWLELLGEHGLTGRGVDQSGLLVEQCRERGLDVAQADALVHLSALPADSLGAVTGFHVVEHVPFARVLALLDEGLRVLRPGGVLIVETPNPENLLVGTHTFYYDPTHRAPLPPRLLEFAARYCGFATAEILRLHAYSPEQHVADSSVLAARLNLLLYGPRDYALIAEKPVRAA